MKSGLANGQTQRLLERNQDSRCAVFMAGKLPSETSNLVSFPCPLTGDGSGLLIMAIVGGALIPFAQGWLADHVGIHHAFILPAICYLYIVYYAFKGSKPKPFAAAAQLWRRQRTH